MCEGSMNDITKGIMYKSEDISCRIFQEYKENSEDVVYNTVKKRRE